MALARNAARRAFSAAAAAFPAPLHFAAPGGARISAWHDIPLQERGADASVFNFVCAARRARGTGAQFHCRILTIFPLIPSRASCEIPRGARAKMEIDTDAPHNPIIQDKTKAGAPRSYGLESLVNYGALAQTYENPAHKDEWTGLLGDGDPVDVCEIGGGAPRATGSVYAVKVIGALAMVDDGEMDWKLLAVRADDALAAGAHCVTDPAAPDAVKKAMDAVREWFRVYKTYEGKGENSFAFDGRWLDAATARAIVASTHKQWRGIVDVRTGTQAKKAPWLPAVGAAWQPLATAKGVKSA